MLVDFLFAANDENPDMVFVDVENMNGESVEVGKWINRGHLWALRVDVNDSESVDITTTEGE